MSPRAHPQSVSGTVVRTRKIPAAVRCVSASTSGGNWEEISFYDCCAARHSWQRAIGALPSGTRGVEHGGFGGVGTASVGHVVPAVYRDYWRTLNLQGAGADGNTVGALDKNSGDLAYELDPTMVNGVGWRLRSQKNSNLGGQPSRRGASSAAPFSAPDKNIEDQCFPRSMAANFNWEDCCFPWQADDEMSVPAHSAQEPKPIDSLQTGKHAHSLSLTPISAADFKLLAHSEQNRFPKLPTQSQCWEGVRSVVRAADSFMAGGNPDFTLDVAESAAGRFHGVSFLRDELDLSPLEIHGAVGSAGKRQPQPVQRREWSARSARRCLWVS